MKGRMPITYPKILTTLMRSFFEINSKTIENIAIQFWLSHQLGSVAGSVIQATGRLELGMPL